LSDEERSVKLQGLPQTIQEHFTEGKWAGSRIVDGYAFCQLLWNYSITTKSVFFTE
jgi:hypothetical protein